MAKRRRDLTILTPTTATADLAETSEKLVYWKQILPEAKIFYTDDEGKSREINFDRQYHEDCIRSFRNGAVDQTCFQLANKYNAHGRDFDPERQRAEVLDMATLDRLPPDVQAKVGGKPGLYAKMKFFDRKAARAVEKNPKLGVSARVRENFTRVDGKHIKRAVIHVLGTIDPRITGMSTWQAADLSYDPDDGYVLDLSENHYQGAKMPKGNSKTKNGVPSEDEIEEMTDEQLDAFLASLDSDDDSDEDEDDSDDELDDDEDEDDEDDEDEDDSDDEDEDDDDAEAGAGARHTVGASLSNKANRQINLANSRAEQANQRANEALRRQARAEFRATRAELLASGVPADAIDLAEPVLARPDTLVVDLSNSGEKDLNVDKIVRGLLDKLRGTVDMSNETGHSGSVDLANGEDDPDEEILEAWEDQFPTGF